MVSCGIYVSTWPCARRAFDGYCIPIRITLRVDFEKRTGIPSFLSFFLFLFPRETLMMTCALCPRRGCRHQLQLVHQQAEEALDARHQEAHEVSERLLRGASGPSCRAVERIGSAQYVCRRALRVFCAPKYGMFYCLPYLGRTFCLAKSTTCVSTRPESLRHGP